jgi:hypothetical protein
MSWARWWAAVLLATLAAIVVSIGAGDFDSTQRDSQRRTAIDNARKTSGVDGHVMPLQQGRAP